MQNTSQAVLARSQSGAQMQFTGANVEQSPTQIIDGPLSESLGVQLSPSRAINVNGRNAAVGQARANTQGGQVDVTAYVIQWQGTMNYIFLWVTPANQTRGASVTHCAERAVPYGLLMPVRRIRRQRAALIS